MSAPAVAERQGRRAHRGRRRRGPRPVWRPEVPAGAVAVVTDLTRAFGTDLTVQHGELVVLVGPARSGGHHLVRCLGGLDRPTAGTVQVSGSVATVFREPRLLPWRTVQDNVALALLGTRLQPVRREKARRLLEAVGLEEHRRSWPRSLTPDQAARTALARAWVTQPRLLLLDDPFAPLGPAGRRRLLRLVHQLWDRERPAVLVSTEDPDVASALADLGARVVTLTQQPRTEKPCP